MERNEIYIKQGTHYKEMTIEILKACDLASDIGDKNKKIGIKPNLVTAGRAENGGVTHPEILDGVLTYLQNEGFNNLEVLEGSWVGDRTIPAAKLSGILGASEKHGVPFFDTQKDKWTQKDSGRLPIKVCNEALSLDYLINLPIIKGHCQTQMTCALKNMKGLIPNMEKRRFHTLGLHKPIAELNSIIHQDFILVDNICGDLDFEEGGNPVPMNRILAFKDPVLCDSFAAQTMGFDPYEIDYIRIAEKNGVGTTDLTTAVVHDLSPEGAAEKTVKPRGAARELGKYVSPCDACSACYGSLIFALNRLDQEGFNLRRRKEKICIGQSYKGKEGVIGIGSCTGCFEKSLAGCPPKAVDIAAFLKKEWS